MSNPKPRIGVTAWFRALETFLGPTPMYTVNDWYVHALRRAGALPVVVPPVTPDDIGAVLDGVDGLLLSGGNDVAPGAYGALRHPRNQDPDTERDAFEAELVPRAIAGGVPTLGICRGAQSVNVALGGTLHPHLPDIAGVGRLHSREDAMTSEVHEVVVEPGSQLAAVVGGPAVGANSMHHQAVAEPGEGVRVVGREAETGIVEALEVEGHPFFLCVQWHPETLAAPGTAHLSLFEALVDASVAARARRP